MDRTAKPRAEEGAVLRVQRTPSLGRLEEYRMTYPQITDRADLARSDLNGADLPGRKLRVEEASRWSGLSVSTLNKLRLSENGPPYLKLGRRVLYDLRDLEAWARERKRHHTSEES